MENNSHSDGISDNPYLRGSAENMAEQSEDIFGHADDDERARLIRARDISSEIQGLQADLNELLSVEPTPEVVNQIEDLRRTLLEVQAERIEQNIPPPRPRPPTDNEWEG